MRLRIALCGISLAAFMGAPGARASELSELRWSDGDGAVFTIKSDQPGFSSEVQTEVLDNGYRLRVYFPGADLAKSIRDIGEVGIVRGVFPYMTDEPTRANFDILLKTPGHLVVEAGASGYQVAIREGSADQGGDTTSVEMAVGAAALPAASTLSGQTAATSSAISRADTTEMSELEKQVLAEIEQQDEPVQQTSSTASAADSGSSSTSVPATEIVADTDRPRIVLKPQVEAEVVDTQSAETQLASQSLAVQPITTSSAQSMASAALIQQEVQLAASNASGGVKEVSPTQPGSASGGGQASMPSPGVRALESIQFSQLPGGRVQINLNVDTGGAQPGVFRTNEPPRVILDFFDTANGIQETIQRVATGALESIVTAETDDRTRVILNLVAPVDYEQVETASGIVLLLASPTAVELANTMRAKPQFDSGRNERLNFSVDNVDFRRTQDGGGTVTVKLNSDAVGVDVREEAGEIVVDLPGTALPASLEKRLDVADFATPVQTIDTFFTGSGTRLIVSPVGEFTHSSYQVGDTLTLQITPPTIIEQEREPDEFGYSGDRLSFNFQKITVRAALQVIADFTGLNFVTSDSVTGDLSLRLQDVPWDQALDTILQVKGLAKRQKGNVIWVAPAEEIASKERQSFEAASQALQLEPLVSELIQINYAKAGDIATILKSKVAISPDIDSTLFGSVSVADLETETNSLLSSRGNVTVDSRTNTILVQDTRPKISEIRKLVAQLDRPVRQVLIETRIVEANEDFSRNIGARLGFSRVTENARFPGVSDSNIGTVAGSANIENNNAILGAGPSGRTNQSISFPADGIGGIPAVSYAFTLAKAGAGFSHLIDLEISALEAEGTGKIIANPRLLTTDQNQASIRQGQERVFTTSVLGEGGVVTKEAVLGLTVTPQITPDDRLILEVDITKDSFAAADDSTINTKSINTKVLLDNGETVVIGGIYEQTQAESTTKVPLLGDIPVLGNLFRKRNKIDNRTELLIFLTPRILKSALTAR